MSGGRTRVLVGCFHSRYTLYGLVLTDLEEAGKPLGPRRELTSDFFFGFPRSGAAESSMAFRQQKRDGRSVLVDANDGFHAIHVFADFCTRLGGCGGQWVEADVLFTYIRR